MTKLSKKLFSLDPGKTNGFAFFKGEDLRLAGWFLNEHETIEDIIANEVVPFSPDEIVMESFRLYPWKAKNQFWSDFVTTEVIGIIKHFAWKNDIPVVMQPASNKQPFPDERLKKMGVYVPNNHARDAIRHGLYRLRFGKEK